MTEAFSGSSQDQNYFHNSTTTSGALFTALTFAPIGQEHCWLCDKHEGVGTELCQ